MMQADKIEDYGLHAHKYYTVEHNFFKSSLDNEMLDRVWNEYWVHTLSTSPLINSKDMICKTVINVVDKIKQLNVHGYGHKSKVLTDEDFNPIQKESAKLAVEVNQGVMIEVLKKFTFACKPGDNMLPVSAGGDEEEKKQQ